MGTCSFLKLSKEFECSLRLSMSGRNRGIWGGRAGRYTFSSYKLYSMGKLLLRQDGRSREELPNCTTLAQFDQVSVDDLRNAHHAVSPFGGT